MDTNTMPHPHVPKPIGINPRAMKKGHCWFFHRWTKWQPYTIIKTYIPTGAIDPDDRGCRRYEITKSFQVRECIKCRLAEDRKVPKLAPHRETQPRRSGAPGLADSVRTAHR